MSEQVCEPSTAELDRTQAGGPAGLRAAQFPLHEMSMDPLPYASGGLGTAVDTGMSAVMFSAPGSSSVGESMSGIN